MHQARFSVGQLVHHKLFDYRGVVFDVDPVFDGSDDWYEQMAKSRPPKDQPWYHVMVDGLDATTYVAERNLEADSRLEPIEHPYLDTFFSDFEKGVYRPRIRSN